MITLVNEMRSPTRVNLAVNACALIAFVALIAARNSWVGSNAFGVGTALVESPAIWTAGTLAVALAAGPWAALRMRCTATDVSSSLTDASSDAVAEGNDVDLQKISRPSRPASTSDSTGNPCSSIM